MFDDVYLLTGNKNKLAEAESILGTSLKHIDLDLDEIQELDPKKVIEHKLKQGYDAVKKPVFLWDVSLCISCLNGFPGPLIKWFWKQVGLEKVCEIVHRYEDTSAEIVILLGYHDGKAIKYFEARTKGHISAKPMGDKGWAWDPIFIPEGHDKTYAQMGEDALKIRTHRVVLEKFRNWRTKQ